jgi:integrase
MSDVGIRKHGNRWQITFYDQHGRRRFETVHGSLTTARKLRAERMHQVQSGKFGLAQQRPVPTLEGFVQRWRQEVAIGLAPSTRRAYETALEHHLLPAFGSTSLDLITKAAVQKFISEKAQQQRWDYTKGKNPNPDRPTLAGKTIRNMIAVLHSVLESAVEDYELLDRNPLAGVLSDRRRRRFPTEKLRVRPKVHVLEPDAFKQALGALRHDRIRRLALVAALAGLRWGELVALRVEDLDWRRNRIRVTRALYRRVPGAPKTEQSEGEVPICPTVRRVLQLVPWSRGYVFSVDGETPIGDGSWIKRQWREAQVAAGIAHPTSWHDLRHLFVSLLIAAGKHPKYIASAARHRDPGFSLRTYGHLFDSMPISAVEWWDDLLWPAGCPHVPAPPARADVTGLSPDAGTGASGGGHVSINAEPQGDAQETAPRAASKGVRAPYLARGAHSLPN